MIFDTTLYTKKPLDTGMDNSMLMISGNNAFWIYIPRLAHLNVMEGVFDDADKLTTIAKAAWEAGYTKMCLDREDGNNIGILQNIETVRKAVPQMQIGVFCFPQVYFNWTKEYTKSVNDAPDVKAIIKELDFSVPGINDCRFDLLKPQGRRDWLKFLSLAISECKRTMPGKPCYPFMSINYDVNTTGKSIVEAENYAWQMWYVLKAAKNAIVWGGFLEEWSWDAEWYRGLMSYEQLGNKRLKPISAAWSAR